MSAYAGSWRAGNTSLRFLRSWGGAGGKRSSGWQVTDPSKEPCESRVAPKRTGLFWEMNIQALKPDFPPSKHKEVKSRHSSAFFSFGRRMDVQWREKTERKGREWNHGLIPFVSTRAIKWKGPAWRDKCQTKRKLKLSVLHSSEIMKMYLVRYWLAQDMLVNNGMMAERKAQKCWRVLLWASGRRKQAPAPPHPQLSPRGTA